MATTRQQTQMNFGDRFVIGSDTQPTSWDRPVRFYEATERYDENTMGFARLFSSAGPSRGHSGKISPQRHYLFVQYVPKFHVDTKRKRVSDICYTEVEIPVELWGEKERRLAELLTEDSRMAA